MTEYNFSLTSNAKNDIEEIWLYIAQDNPIAAENMADRFEEIFCHIGGNPYMGRRRENLTDKPVLFFPVKNYLIIYNAETKPVNILRVLSAYRDIPILM